MRGMLNAGRPTIATMAHTEALGGCKKRRFCQQIRKLNDGGIEISFQVAGLDEIRPGGMSLGPEAEEFV